MPSMLPRSACDGCSKPYFPYYQGAGFNNSQILGSVVVLGISLFLLLVCLGGQAFYIRWAKATGNSRVAYGLAVLFAIISFTLELVETLVPAVRVRGLTRSYLVINVFDQAAFLASAVLTLAVLSNFAFLKGVARIAMKVVLGLLALLGIANVAVYIRATVILINVSTRYDNAEYGYWSYVTSAIGLAFYVLALVSGLALAGTAVVHRRQSSTGLLVAALLALVFYVVFYILLVAAVAIIIANTTVVDNKYAGIFLEENQLNYVNNSSTARVLLWALVQVLIFAAAAFGLRMPARTKGFDDGSDVNGRF